LAVRDVGDVGSPSADIPAVEEPVRDPSNEIASDTPIVPGSSENQSATPPAPAGQQTDTRTEEEIQFELAHVIYRAAFEGIGSAMGRLEELEKQYDNKCTGVTRISGVTEGAEVEGRESWADAALAGRDLPARVRVEVPARRTVSTLRNADTPECKALKREVGDLQDSVTESVTRARDLADKAAIEKGIWTRVRIAVESEVMASLTRTGR